MPPDPSQALEAQRRERLVRAAQQMIAQFQISQNQAARRLGVSAATLSRFLREYDARGLEGLVPGKSTGRPALFTLTEDETNALRFLRLSKGSFALAAEAFAHDKACLPETRTHLQAVLDEAARTRKAPVWPLSLRRAGYVTVEEEALFRGRKAFQEVEHLERRGMWWVNEAGEQCPLLPNTLWESDDMSVNEPFSFHDPLTGGLSVGRQTLCTQDVYSAAYLSASPIGRNRDAYRVEDIAEHMLETVLACGLPDFWRLERGAWENHFIDGIPLAGGVRWGGLDALFGVIRTWTSKGKGGIESSFNLLQSLMAHRSTSIGRTRGEFESGTKQYLRAGAGDERAAREFWGIRECADAMRHAMELFNARPKQRRAFGREMVVAADLYANVVRRELPDSERWRFCPVKREATVRGGHIECVVPHYPLPFRFRVNGGQDGLYLEHGYAVLIAFHPGHPERGCHVFNGQAGARNREGWPLGHLLVVAEPAADAPQFAMSRDEQAMKARKRANAAVASEFRAVVPGRGAAKGGARVSVTRDGYGSSTRLDNASQPAATPTPSNATRRVKPASDDLAAKVAARRADAKKSLGIFNP